jgi:hypothetical protein
MTNSINDNAASFIRSFEGDVEFRPFAYYDKHLDCIRVQVMDCSFKEERKNKFITVLSANHLDESKLAGFNIKGVRYIFKQLGLSDAKVYKMTDLIDKLVQFYPDQASRNLQSTFSKILMQSDLDIRLAA